MVSSAPSPEEKDLVIGVTAPANAAGGAITARKAGGMKDLELCVSPGKVSLREALQNLTQAINLALQEDYLETDLDRVYKGARVRKGAVEVKHRDYIGLGDGVFASLGKLNKSFQLTIKGPDPASPEGKAAIDQGKGGPISGLVSLMGRKLDLLQEFEDKVPLYVEQALDRLEAKGMIIDWHRHEWEITTAFIGLDIYIKPVLPEKETSGEAE